MTVFPTRKFEVGQKVSFLPDQPTWGLDGTLSVYVTKGQVGLVFNRMIESGLLNVFSMTVHPAFTSDTHLIGFQCMTCVTGKVEPAHKDLLGILLELQSGFVDRWHICWSEGEVVYVLGTGAVIMSKTEVDHG